MSQIHQEIVLAASPAAVYRALTDSEEFASLSGAPAQIHAENGGEFICFGTFITGRQIELLEGQRIVQAWRVFDWQPGHYSIVHIELNADGDGTRLVLDQDGVPEDVVDHVGPGWHEKYWKPLQKHVEL